MTPLADELLLGRQPSRGHAPLTISAFLRGLFWIDGTPLWPRIEPYRRAIFDQALGTFDADGRPSFNLIVTGRAKKNWKTADLVLAALFALLSESPHDAQCYLLANDEAQAGDDLALAKLLVKANPKGLEPWLRPRRRAIERTDGRGFLEILPAGDVAGQHGKTYRFCGFDEIHGYRTWDLLEAMQLDPTRLDGQMWITSYATLFHKPGVPLFDLCARGRAASDPRMLFSWYAADYTTDPAFVDADQETRANPSREAWPDQGYLAQQQRRLPAHKYRRLHLNLPGLPEGSPFQPEPVTGAIVRGVSKWAREKDKGVEYRAFVDMSGGSADDAVLAISHDLPSGKTRVDCVMNQGGPAPFDPRKAIARFAGVLAEYGVTSVCGDRYAGETFRRDFERYGVRYEVCELTKSALYEALEPRLNANEVELPDLPILEQQLLGLVWRGGRIDHQSGEHDDFANGAAGAALSGDALKARGGRMLELFGV